MLVRAGLRRLWQEAAIPKLQGGSQSAIPIHACPPHPPAPRNLCPDCDNSRVCRLRQRYCADDRSAHRCADGYPDPGGDRYPNLYRHPAANYHAIADCYSGANGNRLADRYPCAYQYPNTHGNAYAYTSSNSYSNAFLRQMANCCR